MPLKAVRHVRKMRGGAQAHLVEADDSHWYVVKFQNNPQHRRILVNELLASAFLEYLNIAVPEWAVVDIDAAFLAANRDVHISLGTRRVEIEPGWHFGSRYPGDPSRVAAMTARLFHRGPDDFAYLLLDSRDGEFQLGGHMGYQRGTDFGVGSAHSAHYREWKHIGDGHRDLSPGLNQVRNFYRNRDGNRRGKQCCPNHRGCGTAEPELSFYQCAIRDHHDLRPR